MNDFYNSRNFATFGVAGNFTGHLEQAGEDKDFLCMEVLEKNAPKALFPTYIPQKNTSPDFSENASLIPSFLHVFPFSPDKIIFPICEEKIQIESECAILFSAEWENISSSKLLSSNKKLISLKPLGFAASNDCSIRKEGAKKISLKKNWGKCSKGLSSNIIPLEEFSENSLLNDYRISSFLIRKNEIFVYGEDSPIKNYSYIYEKLKSWLIDKFNNQRDEGPAENILSYLKEASYPEKIMVSIGATRYTNFGEHNFLENGDKSCVILYPENRYSPEKIKEILYETVFLDSHFECDVSALIQTVLLQS